MRGIGAFRQDLIRADVGLRFAGNLRAHDAEFLAGNLASGVPSIEDVRCVLTRELTISAMGAVGISPIADARHE